MEVQRLSLPMAYADPAFIVCVSEAIDVPELVEQFDRLYGAHLTAGNPAEEDMRAFAEFVHDGIYMRLPDEAIHSLRAESLAKEVSHG